MSSTTTSVITETDVRQVIRTADALTVENDYAVAPMDTTITEANEDEDDAFLTANHGVTGREPNTNPEDWLTNHRRMPPHRPPVRHADWQAVGGPLPMRIFIWNMFAGCQILQWSYSFARGVGLHDRGYAMYQIANEW
ncbi:hypothetical protein NX059_004362 [Plenodomus lindquistii]|nr:hypothetical protein NX059_004362 [Plenodomus lindquistii]